MRYLLLPILIVFTLSACTPAPSNQNNTSNTNTANQNNGEVVPGNTDDEMNDSGTMDEQATDDGYVLYENKAMAYSIEHPTGRWYWRHYISTELAEAMPSVKDIYVADINPLLGLGSEYLGMVMIEVSTRDVSDYVASLQGFDRTDVTLAGQAAARYQGIRSEGSYNNTTWIEYLFAKDGMTYRFVFNQSDAQQEQIQYFEHIVQSFQFVQ